MDPKRRKKRVRNPRPFKITLKRFVQDHKITLIFVLLIFGFVTFYLFGLDMYWKSQYARAGFGYLFQ
jgi:hypothetical protein